MTKDDVFNFIKKHREGFGIAAILFVCYFLYFFSMGHYPLIDVDETRYVSMAREMFHTKDFLTLHLNSDFFFEKPPLYFWIESVFFMLFRHVSEVSARIPVALTATYGVFLVYFLGRKISSKKYGMISALILASCFEYIVLARVAILDMLLAVCIATSAFAGIYTLFCSENYKKYFWWFAYIFAGFGLLAKGVPGLAIPVITVFAAYVIAKRTDEMFKPLYFIPGLIFFFIISIPWHMVMLHQYGHYFFHEYVYKHHVERFVNSNELGRKEPFWYFFGVFFLGFMPWIFSFISQIVVYLKKYVKNTFDYFSKFNDLQRLEQFILLNAVYFIVVFLFFSMASTKLPTYILPAMFPASLILGKFWFDFICKDENERAINISTLVLNFAFLGAAAALIVIPHFLEAQDKSGLEAMQIPGLILIFAFVIVNSFAIFKDKKLVQFISIVSFMMLLSCFAARLIFPYVVSFGQDELIDYAKIAKSKNTRLSAIGFGSRYSLLYYRGDNVEFWGDINPEETDLCKDSYVVVKNNRADKFKKYYDYQVVKEGKKYSLYSHPVKKESTIDKKHKRHHKKRVRRHKRV